MVHDHGPLPFADARDVPDHLVSLVVAVRSGSVRMQRQTEYSALTKTAIAPRRWSRDTAHSRPQPSRRRSATRAGQPSQYRISRHECTTDLRNELYNRPQDVEGTLGVRNAHGAVQPVDRPIFSRVVVAYRRQSARTAGKTTMHANRSATQGRCASRGRHEARTCAPIAAPVQCTFGRIHTQVRIAVASPTPAGKKGSHFQHIFRRNGSETFCPAASTPTSSHVSTAQNGIGTRIQFKPAPAISATSSSVMNVS